MRPNSPARSTSSPATSGTTCGEVSAVYGLYDWGASTTEPGFFVIDRDGTVVQANQQLRSTREINCESAVLAISMPPENSRPASARPMPSTAVGRCESVADPDAAGADLSFGIAFGNPHADFLPFAGIETGATP